MPISIVTVTLHARAQLAETIDSLNALRGQFDEFLVIDGDSADGTREMIAAESLVTAWRSEPDRGIYDAMNKAWLMARPDNHLLFLGAGDRLLSLPTFELATDTIYYGEVEMERHGRFVSRHGECLKLGNTLHHQALLVPRRLHPASPFDLRFPVYADYDLNLRLYLRGVKFQCAPGFLTFATGGGVSGFGTSRELRAVVAKNLGLLGAARQQIRTLRWRLNHRMRKLTARISGILSV